MFDHSSGVRRNLGSDASVADRNRVNEQVSRTICVDVGVNHWLAVCSLRNESAILNHLQVRGTGSPLAGEVIP